MTTLSYFNASPCGENRGTITCKSTHIRYNERHAWCAECGAKRDIPVTPKKPLIERIAEVILDPDDRGKAESHWQTALDKARRILVLTNEE